MAELNQIKEQAASGEDERRAARDKPEGDARSAAEANEAERCHRAADP